MSHLLSALAVLSLPTLAAAQSEAAVATYEVVFDATWSMETHPATFPGGGRFSPLIGGTHAEPGQFWSVGTLASDALEALAENGSQAGIAAEVQAAMAAGMAGEVVAGTGITFSPGSSALTFNVTSAHSRITLVSMIAPSPDWFVGVDGAQLFVEGQWVEELTGELFALDAGTDSGADFSSPDEEALPHRVVEWMSNAPFTGTVALGTFTFRRLASATPYGSGVNPEGSLRLTSGAPTSPGAASFALSDPTGEFGYPQIPLVLISQVPGSILASGVGLGPVGAPGELLVGVPAALVLEGPAVLAGDGLVDLAIPDVPALVGLDYYAQGVLVDVAAVRVGLTEGLQLVIGG